jgi:hypothetical protein
MVLALLVVDEQARAEPTPMCPSGRSAPLPTYGPLNGAPSVATWRNIDMSGNTDCAGSIEGRWSLVVAVAGRFNHAGSIDELAGRIGAISSTEGHKYWSTTDRRWRVLITDAFALEAPDAQTPRDDFTADEVLRGGPLFFAQDDTRSTGPNVYRLDRLAVGAERLAVKIVNVTPIGFLFVTLFEPDGLRMLHFIERLEPNVWGYYGVTAARDGSVRGSETSLINRADAFYRFLSREPSTARLPLAP